MADLAKEQGVNVTIATVDGIEFAEDGLKPLAVLATDDSGNQVRLPATDVVFAAGPWTASVAKKLLGRRAYAALDIGPRCVLSSVLFFSPD